MTGAPGLLVQTSVAKEQKVDFGTAKETQLAGHTEKKLPVPVQICVVLVSTYLLCTVLEKLNRFYIWNSIVVRKTSQIDFFVKV